VVSMPVFGRPLPRQLSAPDVELRMVLLVTVVNCSDALLLTLARNQSRQNWTDSQIVCRAPGAGRRTAGTWAKVRFGG